MNMNASKKAAYLSLLNLRGFTDFKSNCDETTFLHKKSGSTNENEVRQHLTHHKEKGCKKCKEEKLLSFYNMSENRCVDEKYEQLYSITKNLAARPGLVCDDL